MAQLKNYKYSDVQTDIERFEGDEFCVIIKWDGESKTIETFQRGYKDSLYAGEGMEDARESTGLSQEDWDSLLSVDVQYMVRVVSSSDADCKVSGVTVRADYENNAELFWDTIREKHPAIAEKLQANANVFLTDEEWETVQAVEGFEDGPNYARTALLEVEE